MLDSVERDVAVLQQLGLELDYTLDTHVAEAFPKVFEQRECAVKVIRAERTFWEKATILHHETHRPEGNPQPPRYSRH